MIDETERAEDVVGGGGYARGCVVVAAVVAGGNGCAGYGGTQLFSLTSRS